MTTRTVGTVPTAPTYSTIAAAIVAAVDGDTIQITVPGTFHEHLTVNKSLTFKGTGEDSMLDGSGNGRCMAISAGKTVHIQDMIVQNGYAHDEYGGGGILNSGILYLDSGTQVRDCYSDGPILGETPLGLGGGIANAGTLTMNPGSFVSGNRAVQGGGVYNTGTMNLAGGVVELNTVHYNAGGIYNDTGILNILSGSIRENVSMFGGGVLTWGVPNTPNSGKVTMSGGEICNNTVVIGEDRRNQQQIDCGTGGGIGAGIFLDGGSTKGCTFTMTGGEIYGNVANYSEDTEKYPITGNGGGIFSSANVVIQGGSIHDNIAEGNGGAIGADGCGSIAISGGSLKNNSAGISGGAIFAACPITLSATVSLSGNTAQTEYGGGIYVSYEPSWGDAGALTIKGTGVRVEGNTAHLPATEKTWKGWGVYAYNCTPKGTNGFVYASQIKGNLKK